MCVCVCEYVSVCVCVCVCSGLEHKIMKHYSLAFVFDKYCVLDDLFFRHLYIIP